MLGLIIALILISLPIGLLGLRLLRKAAAPSERILGCGFVVASSVLLPRILSARMVSEALTGPLVYGLNLFAHAMAALGFGLLCEFTRRVFRPDARWAYALLGCLLLVVLAPVVPAALATPRRGVEFTPFTLVSSSLLALPVLWTFVECAIYANRMRKRSRLGLADPVLANRFRLWAVWTGSLGLTPIVVLPFRLGARALAQQGLVPAQALPWLFPAVTGAVGCLMLVSAVAGWLAFVPPKRYLRWLQGRARVLPDAV